MSDCGSKGEDVDAGEDDEDGEEGGKDGGWGRSEREMAFES